MNEPRPATFDDILAECLDDLLRERRTLAECLEAYPEYADELKPALQIAFLTMRLKSAEMPPARVDALEKRLMAGMTAPIPLRPRTTALFGLSRMAAVILVTFLLLVGSGAGLVAASADDLPGDTLYGVKRLWETIVLSLSPVTGQPGDLWLQIANTRLSEAEQLSAQGRLTDEALADLYEASYYVTFYGGDASKLIEYFNRAFLALFDRIKPPANSDVIYREVVDALNPANRFRDGVLQPMTDDTPPSLRGGFSAEPTPTATNTPVPLLPTDTPSPTATSTPTDTPTLTPTVTLTSTPRIPPTATRTPTFTPSPTPTVTYTPTPTFTWTPLPLPGGVQSFSSPATPVPPAIVPTTAPVTLPTLDATERVRATQQSVYMTQTAGPPLVTPTEEP